MAILSADTGYFVVHHYQLGGIISTEAAIHALSRPSNLE